MVKVRTVLALIALTPLGLTGCSFVRDLAIDAFLPEARPLIDELRKAKEPAAETPALVSPPVVLPNLPSPVSPPLPPIVETKRPEPTPPPKPPSVLSPDDEAERRAIEMYEQRLDEIKRSIERATKPKP